MPPLQRLTTAAATKSKSLFSIYDDLTVVRESVQPVGTIDAHTLTVMCISLSFATISVIAAQFAFYWFIRMRRGFRQDMIMLLIQSDMSKALWLIVSPLVYFITKKPLSSHRAFCQVSGFFLSASIEASDIAILLIAIHTVLFIVKGRHTGTNFGLQPYRRVAYTLWATVPIILAAIVPITGGSFVDSGSYCYLPLEPQWYRISLAWTPRYVVFSFIIVTYTALYLYVHIHFRRFGRVQRSAGNSSSASARSAAHRHAKRKWRSRSVPPTPDLTNHGLLGSTHTSISKNYRPSFRQYSDASTTESTLKVGGGTDLPSLPELVARRNFIAWNLGSFKNDGQITTTTVSPHIDIAPHKPTTELTASTSDEITTGSNILGNATVSSSILTPEPAHITSNSDVESSSRIRRGSRRNRWQQRSHPRSSDASSGNSVAGIISVLRRGPPRSASTPIHLNDEERGAAGKEEEEHVSTEPSSVHLPPEEYQEAMRRSRERMQRQMRLLFVARIPLQQHVQEGSPQHRHRPVSRHGSE
ncbi:hypothetical protein NPX13_g10150 [Xylaria arbuscula]|uniref:Glucose receptor Git3-like N-terminal domain-containing protein n=1 Tax=Xylaria arbuscula TaxID=114810 RepID=A0A9W8N5B5_9PEZI|nr:hypothetical protein NPX13_g10150 [Xylaria arbuscula]